MSHWKSHWQDYKKGSFPVLHFPSWFKWQKMLLKIPFWVPFFNSLAFSVTFTVGFGVSFSEGIAALNAASFLLCWNYQLVTNYSHRHVAISRHERVGEGIDAGARDAKWTESWHEVGVHVQVLRGLSLKIIARDTKEIKITLLTSFRKWMNLLEGGEGDARL